jgi:transcriptional regulator with XRE-family HTH domain
MTTLGASDIAARRIREARKKRGWTVKDLAAECATAGVPHLTAPVITNLETRRRPGREISAEELVALAWVLEVPPVQLLSPLDGTEALQVVPCEDMDPVNAAAWLSDEDASIGPVRLAASSRPEDTERALRYRGSPLTVIRQIRAAARAIMFHDRLLASEDVERLWPGNQAHHRQSVPILGVRLLHLLASLEALGYSRPPLAEVMAILARYGIPPTLPEWEQREAAREGVSGGEGA